MLLHKDAYSEFKSQAYLGLYVKIPIFLSGFKQIWNLSSDFHRSPHQISRKYVQWEPRRYVRTEGECTKAPITACYVGEKSKLT
jgi:hypothetical protein